MCATSRETFPKKNDKVPINRNGYTIKLGCVRCCGGNVSREYNVFQSWLVYSNSTVKINITLKASLGSKMFFRRWLSLYWQTIFTSIILPLLYHLLVNFLMHLASEFFSFCSNLKHSKNVSFSSALSSMTFLNLQQNCARVSFLLFCTRTGSLSSRKAVCHRLKKEFTMT